MSFALVAVSACTNPVVEDDGEEPTEIYVSSPREHGMARAQVGELVPYEQTHGWLCTPPAQADQLLEYYLKE